MKRYTVYLTTGDKLDYESLCHPPHHAREDGMFVIYLNRSEAVLFNWDHVASVIVRDGR